METGNYDRVGELVATGADTWEGDVADSVYGVGHVTLTRTWQTQQAVHYSATWHALNEPATMDWNIHNTYGDGTTDASATWFNGEDVGGKPINFNFEAGSLPPARNVFSLSTSQDVAATLRLVAKIIGAEEGTSSGILTDKADKTDVYTKNEANSRFIASHQQLQPIYGGNGQKFTSGWTVYRSDSSDQYMSDGVDVTSQLYAMPEYTDNDGGRWLLDSSMITGDHSPYVVGYDEDTGVLFYQAISDTAGHSVLYKAIHIQNPIIGYVLGDQTPHLQPQGNYLTEHQSWNDVKPSGGIPKTDLASTVQTSLDKADALATKIAAAAAVTISNSNDITVRELRTAILAIQAALAS